MITGYMLVIEQVLAPDGTVHESCEEAPLFDGADGPHIWHWSDGNMSCDCNRALVCGADSSCGEVKYKLNLLRADTREVLYREFRCLTVTYRGYDV